MKPIKLKIRGLNSFIEEQVIDFERLTERGFFGIFGPTGSGKSTVLDGITLALYGEVARKSSNFINTNCDTMSISFEFEISGTEKKRYLVEREFKRNKNGGCNSGKVRLADISQGKGSLIVLEDKVSGVNKGCIKAIGLGLDDFTRTVVLPQGKFSEFLTLNGKERTDMLERIFNLHEYGIGLSDKLNRKMSKIKGESDELKGKLSGYEGVSKEILEGKNKDLELSNKELKELTSEKNKFDAIFEESKEVWLNLNDLKQKNLELANLKDEENNIAIFKEKVSLGESALKIKPYMDSYDNNLNELVEIEKSINSISHVELELRNKKEKLTEAYKETKGSWEKEVPELTRKLQVVNDCIEESKKIEEIQLEVDKLKKNRTSLLGRYKEYKVRIEGYDGEEKKLKEVLENGEKHLETLKFEGDFKQKVNKGVLISSNLNRVMSDLEVIKRKIDTLNLEVKEESDKKELLKVQLLKEQKELKENENDLKECTSNCPGEVTDVIERSSKLSEHKEKWNNYNRLNEVKIELEGAIFTLSKQEEELKEKKCELEYKVDSLSKEVKNSEIENLVVVLRRELNDGDECPVCGGIHHNDEKYNKEIVHGLNDLEESLKSERDKLNNIVQEEVKVLTTFSSKTKELLKIKDDIIQLGDDFKSRSYEEEELLFNDFKKSIDNYIKKKEELEKNVLLLKERINEQDGNLKVILNNIKLKEYQIKELLIEHEKTSNEYEKIRNSMYELINETGVNDFEKKQLEIEAADKKYNELYNEMKRNRSRLEQIATDRNKCKEESDEIVKNGQEIKGLIEGKELNQKEKEDNIKNKVGENINLKALCNDISSKISKIEDDFSKTEGLKEKIEKEYQDCNEKLQGLVVKEKLLSKSLDENKVKLDLEIKEEGFNSLDEVRKNIILKSEINIIKSKIDKFIEDMAKLSGAIESINIKLNGRVITEEKWEEIKGNKILIENKIKSCEEECIKLKEEVVNVSKKLNEQMDLLKLKEEYEHKMALIKDLFNLFKGKKFVGYIAISQLKYISVEASKRLKSISGGNYGLEVDIDGKFIIRDYKNGGAERDASTLSGGETFLASLALALALSSQIQLKGTAPLELFFLDEGFGTLDENLLEVVIASLEKIHNDKLKIGLISHVETIKNRVPVKLLISPAESGRGGSKAKIEIT